MKVEHTVGLFVYLSTAVLAGSVDDCLLMVKRSCSKQNPCPTGSQCIAGRCRCPIKPVFCPSGVIGPRCSFREPCKPGYTCRVGQCCRDDCPAGWSNGGECNNKPGQERCRSGYDCINNFCCRRKIIIDPPRRCPVGQIQVPGTCRLAFPYPRKSYPPTGCPGGSTCHRGICCKTQSKCPKGEIPVPGLCRVPFSPVGKKPISTCRRPARCYKGTCCSSIIKPPSGCPFGQTQVPGTCLQIPPTSPGNWPNLKCPVGSTCYKGMCCRSDKIPTCPKRHIPAPGQCPKCSQGAVCYKARCCRPLFVPFPNCPKVLQLSGKEKSSICPVYVKNPDECKNNIDCLKLGKGGLCCTDRCGRKYCQSPFDNPPFPLSD